VAERFGRQCTVLAVDAKEVSTGKWQVVVMSGKKDTGIDVVDWVKAACDKGAGEILLTSWDRDGTRQGYDLELMKAVSNAVNVPVIASGGADNPRQLLEGLEAGAEAVLAASIFHYGEYTVGQIKEYLREKGVEVRL
jgi:cyclase